MSVLKLDELRRCITQALHEGALDASVQHCIEHKGPLLQGLLKTSCDTPKQLLLFTRAYIEQLPLLLLSAEQQAEHLGWGAVLRPVWLRLQSFFLEPATLNLQPMLARAYVVHRALEELNDQCIFQQGWSLLAIESTRPNLLVQQLLGEAPAQQLEHLLPALLTPALLRLPAVPRQTLRPQEAWARRPCLAQESGLAMIW